MAGIAKALVDLRTQVVLVVGDRVEAFAAAAAAHLCGIPVAHVHGGDRAAGQVDDSLRHAITKLSHIHFPATPASAERLLRLGEEAWRIKRVGSPGIDGVTTLAAPVDDLRADFGEVPRRRFALLLLHPGDPDESVEYARATRVARLVAAVGFGQVVVIYPNNDPGSSGIVRAWKQLAAGPDSLGGRWVFRPDVPRPLFLALLRDAAVLVGNSSSGIIEAASFGTPVIDIGRRQQGRECGANVTHVPYGGAALARALRSAWNDGAPLRYPRRNIYGAEGTGRRIANGLARLKINRRLMAKLIAY